MAAVAGTETVRITVNEIFFAGHGSPSSHSVATGPGMTPGLYESERVTINGSGQPPFNSTPYPQVNFLHLVACNCGDTSNFKTALYPYYMGWGGPYLENQALLAYTCYTSQNHRAKNAELIWEKLALGWTLGYIKSWLENIWLPANAGQSPIALPMSDVDPPNWRDAQIGDLNLVSGPDNGAMRVKSVYTGTNALPAGWYLPL